MTPTSEQAAAVDLFQEGNSLAIEAGAGTGKTSTLTLIGQADQGRRGQYVAFNKAIATEAGARMPGNVTASTAHSLAYRSVMSGNRDLAARLRSPRMRSQEIARILGIDPLVVSYGSERKPLAPAFLAGLTMRAVTRFCQSADREVAGSHVPYVEGIDLPTSDGRRTYANNAVLRRHLAGALRKAWADLSSPRGRLPYKHEHYLKTWHLSGPVINAEFILFDEAQDANPVLVDIVAQQAHAQLVWVGDSQQSIYEWTGAINALATVPSDQRTFLTQSFRFGSEVASVANGLLDRLGADLRLRGSDQVASVVGPCDDPDVVLTRTNAEGVRRLFDAVDEGLRVALIGGAADVAAFVRAAQQLQTTGFTAHPELACFTSWGEVQEYVFADSQGDELRRLVDLVDEYGPDRILGALDRMPPERDADLVVSTAHKAKGREWPSVQLAGDFVPPKDGGELPPEELRLLYVACTRAKRELDVTAVPHALAVPEPAAPTVPPLAVH